MRMSSGSAPSSATPYCSAMRAPPPLPKMGSSWPHFEQTCVPMFSTMPSTGTPTFWNILQSLAGIEQRDVLRRRHDDRARSPARAGPA